MAITSLAELVALERHHAVTTEATARRIDSPWDELLSAAGNAANARARTLSRLLVSAGCSFEANARPPWPSPFVGEDELLDQLGSQSNLIQHGYRAALDLPGLPSMIRSKLAELLWGHVRGPGDPARSLQ